MTGWGFNQVGGKGWGGKRSASVNLGVLLTCLLAIWLLFVLGSGCRLKMYFCKIWQLLQPTIDANQDYFYIREIVAVEFF